MTNSPINHDNKSDSITRSVSSDKKVSDSTVPQNTLPKTSTNPPPDSKQNQANNTPNTVNKKKSRTCCWIGGCLGIFILVNIFPFIGAGLGILGGWRGTNSNPNLPFLGNIARQSGNKVLPTPNTTPVATTPTASSPSTSKTTSKPKTSTASNSTTTTPAQTSTPSTPASSTSTPRTPNSPAPSPTTPPQVVTYTRQQQIDFFIQVAMKNDQNNFVTIPIQKWKTNAGAVGKIRYYNDPTGSDLTCADQTISQINSLSNTIHFSKTTGNDYNVRVYFVPKSQIGSSIGGYYNYSTDANHYVTGGNAYVPIDSYNEVDRCHYIRHEMTHVMTGLAYNGLRNHGGYDFSIFNVSSGKSDYLDIDKYAIRIMLNSGVQLGWNESQVRAYLTTAQW